MAKRLPYKSAENVIEIFSGIPNFQDISRQKWNKFGNWNTPAGVAWLSVQRSSRTRDAGMRRWVFMLGFLMGLTWATEIRKQQNDNLKQLLDAQLDKDIGEFVRRSRVELIK